MAAETQRTYIEHEPAPSVVSLNGVVASLALTEALDHFTGFAGRDLDLPRSLVYDGRRGTVRSVAERGQTWSL